MTLWLPAGGARAAGGSGTRSSSAPFAFVMVTAALHCIGAASMVVLMVKPLPLPVVHVATRFAGLE